MGDPEIEKLVQDGELYEERPLDELDDYGAPKVDNPEVTFYSGSGSSSVRRTQDWRFTPCSPDEIDAMNRIEDNYL